MSVSSRIDAVEILEVFQVGQNSDNLRISEECLKNFETLLVRVW